MANDNAFTVHIYANEYEYMKWLVLQKQDIETGGDLFGVWRNELSAVVQFVLGPGIDCRRTSTSFHQDVGYLENVGKYLTSSEGICNIGEWHSHHRIGLAQPSDGDKNTVWSHMGTVSGGRFLVFIANIQGTNSVHVGCFMFNSVTGKMTEGKMNLLANCSPIRHTFSEKAEFRFQAETYQEWESFYMSKLPIYNRCMLVWRGSQVDDLESGIRKCVCDIPESDCCERCWVCFRGVITWVFRCLAAMFSACGRCCICILRPCWYYLYRKCCSRRPARD